MFSVAGRSVITFVIEAVFQPLFDLVGGGTVVAPWAVVRSRDEWRGPWWVSIRLARNAQLDEVL